MLFCVYLYFNTYWYWRMFSCNTDYVFSSNAFSSELDHCCCIWHLVLLITNKPLEHDFLCKLHQTGLWNCYETVCIQTWPTRLHFKMGAAMFSFYMILSLKPFSLFSFSSFLNIGNMVGFLHIPTLPFGLRASRCAGSRVPLQWLVKYFFFFNGIKTAICSLM